jgi:fructoselysine 6-kinase
MTGRVDMVRLLGLGDNTVDTDVGAALQFPGGNAVNVAVLARRAGAQAGYLGCIGSDAAGALVRDALAAEGVDISRLRTRPGANARALIAYRDGDRRFLGSRPGVRAQYRLDAADFDYIATFDLTHCSIYGDLQAELPRIRTAAPLLSFDFSERWTATLLRQTLPHIDIAFLSAPDADDAACARLLRDCLDLGTKLAVVTRGMRGAWAMEPGSECRQSALPTTVVDTLGAGDGFIAACLVARLRGAGLSLALRAGAEMAAQVCTWRGGFGHAAPWDGEQEGIVMRQQSGAAALLPG